MANPYVNKVVYGGTTLIDLTADTVTANDVSLGKVFHAPDGSTQVGLLDIDVGTLEEFIRYMEIEIPDVSRERF